MADDLTALLRDERQLRQVARGRTEALDEPRLVGRAEGSLDDRRDRLWSSERSARTVTRPPGDYLPFWLPPPPPRVSGLLMSGH